MQLVKVIDSVVDRLQDLKQMGYPIPDEIAGKFPGFVRFLASECCDAYSKEIFTRSLEHFADRVWLPYIEGSRSTCLKVHWCLTDGLTLLLSLQKEVNVVLDEACLLADWLQGKEIQNR